jgi:DNA-binding NarL/FixJ family response regulator
MIRVLIADDHPIIRQGLRSTLDETQDIRVVGEAKDGFEAVAMGRSEEYDVMLLDLSMPGVGGVDVLKQLLHELPDRKVLILSTYPEKQYAVRCLKAGARGYVTKESAAMQLLDAIRRVAAGRKYVSAALAEQLAGDLQFDAVRPPHESLSDREFQVLCLLGQGQTPSDIAAQLALSVTTVNTYRARILAKMGLETNAQLMLYVLENRLIDTP